MKLKQARVLRLIFKASSRFAAQLLFVASAFVLTPSAQAVFPRAVSLMTPEVTGLIVEKGRSEIEIRIYFTNPKLPEWASSCGAGEFVKRRRLATKRPADAALRLLFAGPTAEEKARGMESLGPLGGYYRSVSIKKGGVAVVNFRPGAEKYLHVAGSACQQEQVLTPIVETLKQFRNIKSVKYAINGKVITDWDA